MSENYPNEVKGCALCKIREQATSLACCLLHFREGLHQVELSLTDYASWWGNGSGNWIPEHADLQGYSFVFAPKGYVTLEMDRPRELLQNVTVCLCSFSDSPSQQALFSYATKDQDKEILIYKAQGLDGFWWYTVYIGGVAERFRIPDFYQNWQRVCVVWASETGVLTLWLDRSPLARKFVRQGYFIKPHGSVQLGRAHHEDIFFRGEIQQVYMWNRNVNIMADTLYPFSMISWKNMSYTTHGHVVLDYLSYPGMTCQP